MKVRNDAVRVPVLALGVFFSVLSSLTAAATAAPDPVDEVVHAVMKRHEIPGVSVAIVRGGKLVKAQGYGLANVELDVPASAETVYQSGSLGKQFTAAGILVLVDEGRLDLDDPLARHFPAAPAAWHRITVRHLLTHTSGLKDYSDEEIDFRRDYTEDELLEIAMKVPIQFEPGTQWSYSNTGFMVLGILISKLAGEHWSDFLAERVFAPAGMTTARVITESGLVMNRAAGYARGESGELRNQAWVAPSLNRLGDGALYFTVEDLAAWELALRDRKILSEASYDAWWTPVQLGDGTTYPYGFGWGLGEQRGRRVIAHGGSWQGFRAAIARYVEDDLMVAVLTNVSDAEPEAIAQTIAGALVEGLRFPGPQPEGPDPDAARTARLEEVLRAWSRWRTHPDMGRGLAATASGSAREAYSRSQAGKRLSSMERFVWLADDELAGRPMPLRGETVTRIAYYRMEVEDGPFLYRFYLTADGRVAEFDSTSDVWTGTGP